MTANHRPLEDGDIELIDRVRASPCLYDTKDPDFRLVYKKDYEWQSVADGLGMSHWEARKRWTVLRDRYARELKQLILHPDSTEYGKNDFFLRMDFIRNFVKKREVRRKRVKTHGLTNDYEENPRPIKLFKIKCDTNSLDSEGSEVSKQEKSYLIDNSEDLSTEKFSYIEQTSQEPSEQGKTLESISTMDQEGGEQEYHDYVEEGSVTYDVEDHETLTQTDSESYTVASVNSRGSVIKPDNSKLAKNFSVTDIEEDNICTQQQKNPIITNVCSESVTPSLPVDTEEYFSRTIAPYLRQLSPRYKIKAKVEMMQIIAKYLDLEESKS